MYVCVCVSGVTATAKNVKH